MKLPELDALKTQLKETERRKRGQQVIPLVTRLVSGILPLRLESIDSYSFSQEDKQDLIILLGKLKKIQPNFDTDKFLLAFDGGTISGADLLMAHSEGVIPQPSQHQTLGDNDVSCYTIAIRNIIGKIKITFQDDGKTIDPPTLNPSNRLTKKMIELDLSVADLEDILHTNPTKEIVRDQIVYTFAKNEYRIHLTINNGYSTVTSAEKIESNKKIKVK